MLVLVATPIGNVADISARAVAELTAADSVACEDTRRTGALFARLEIAHAPFIICNEHTERRAAEEIVSRVARGERVALVSDAGTPGVSDPGQRVVEAVLAAGQRVEAIPGPSAALVAVTISGFSTDRFCVEGFLPRKGAERGARIRELVAERRTSVLFEAPHRLGRTIDDLTDELGADRRIVLARELTKRFEEIWRGTLTEAVAHVRDVEPRGEYVLVIEGAPAGAITADMLIEELKAEREQGASRRQAVDAVVGSTGAKKRQVYDLALQLDFESANED